MISLLTVIMNLCPIVPRARPQGKGNAGGGARWTRALDTALCAVHQNDIPENAPPFNYCLSHSAAGAWPPRHGHGGMSGLRGQPRGAVNSGHVL